VKAIVQKLAEACFEKVVLDVTHLSLLQPARVAQFLVDTFRTAADLGISVVLVASEELPKAMRGFQETKDVHCFASVEQARSQAA
jgi:two-component system cell cycle response regulator